MPRVTVLMSAYNSENYLLESIESILSQTFKDFEFLIINDGSIDSTREIVLSINDPRIRLVDNSKNLGLTLSLNKGLRLANGEFVARIDSDDIAEPTRLERQVDYLDTHPDVALLGTWHTEVDADGNFVGMWDLPSTWIQIRWALFFYTPFVHSSIMLRKALVLDQVGFYNEALSYSQDYELWARIAKVLPTFSLNERLVKTRVNPFSMTATYGERALEGFRIRATTVSQLLGQGESDAPTQVERLNKMTMFLSGFSYNPDLRFHDFNATDVIQVVEELIQLHAAFCQSYKLSKNECRTHRMEVYSAISTRLFELANIHVGQDSHLVWQALAHIARLKPQGIFTKRYFRLALKSLMGLQTFNFAGS